MIKVDWKILINDIIDNPDCGRDYFTKKFKIPVNMTRALLYIIRNTPIELVYSKHKNYTPTQNYETYDELISNKKIVDKISVTNEANGELNNLNRPLTISEIIEKFKVNETFDLESFEYPPEITIESFDVSMKLAKMEKVLNDDGSTKLIRKISEQPITKRNYLTKVKFKPKKHNSLTSKDIDKIFNNLSVDIMKNIAPIKKKTGRYKGKILIEPCIYDPHIGMLCVQDNDNSIYNSEIAKKQIENIVQQSIQIGCDCEASDVLLTIGNDNMHIDNTNSTTTKGTKQTVDLPYFPLFDLTTNIWINAITNFSKFFQTVHVKVISGNHDDNSCRYLYRILKLYFIKNENILFDNNEGDLNRQYFQFGNVAIGLSHGKYEGNRIKNQMQAEKPKLWGETKYREFHCAHVHSEDVQEYHGIKIRRIPTIAPSNDWHNRMGFTGALKTAQLFIWDYEKGLTGIRYIK